jgi:ketosteroid isomerase-like protein
MQFMGKPSWALVTLIWFLGACTVQAQQADIDAIKAADNAFYTALNGRDLSAMKTIWADAPGVVNIGPKSKVRDVGYDATIKYWERAFNFFSKFDVSKSEVRIRSDGTTAWVVGIENAILQPSAGGDPLEFETFVTHVFEKQGGRWLLVLHHAQMIPK